MRKSRQEQCHKWLGVVKAIGACSIRMLVNLLPTEDSDKPALIMSGDSDDVSQRYTERQCILHRQAALEIFDGGYNLW